jgi:UDP-glucose 4-epimerase
VAETRPADVLWYITDNRLAAERLGWRPKRHAETVLRDIRDWLQANSGLLNSLFGAPA